MTGHASLFAAWLRAMGLNGKEVSKGGRMLGMETRAAVRRNTGAVEVSQTERLAMAALRAGLPPWSPEADEMIAGVGIVTATVRAVASQVRTENQAARRRNQRPSK